VFLIELEGNMANQEIREAVRERYAEAARRVEAGEKACCGPTCCDSVAQIVSARDPITADLYEASETLGLPVAAVQASLGCGNPTALASLDEGETVLDLGSGGGVDALLSARRVGPTGRVYGLDMTDEMLALARENAATAGATNVEFLKGELENVPLPGGSIDVIISNCVVNLSADKDRALAEAFRVLKPGGRFAVSDVVVRGEVPADVRRSVEFWIGCLAGALEEKEFEEKLRRAGFTDVTITPTRVYEIEEAREFLAAAGVDADALAPQVGGKFMSAFVRAVKPA
jgi:SAM-dependent methyltransferase